MPSGFVPGGIGGQDQGRDLWRRTLGRGDRRRAVGRDRFRVGRGPHPGRHRPRQAFDIGGQRRIEPDVIGRVLADDVDDAGMGLLGVVQVGEAIGEARPKVQQGRCRRALHAEITVGRARHHALEQAKHAAHALDPIQRRDKMHLRGTGIGEADINAARDQGPHQTFRTVHRSTPVRDSHLIVRAAIGGKTGRALETLCRSITPGAFRQRFRGHCCHRRATGWFFNRSA